MMPLMPMLAGDDNGVWSFVSLTTGGSGVTLPADLQEGDFGVLLTEVYSQTNGTGTPPGGVLIPSGWTQLLSRTASTFTPPLGNNGEGKTSKRVVGIIGRALSPALSGTVVTQGNSGSYYASRLLLFRNSRKKTPVLTLFPLVTGAYPATAINFAASGSPALAGLAFAADVDANPTFSGALFQNQFEYKTYSNNAIYANLQRPGVAGTVQSAAVGVYRPFAVGVV